MLQVYDYGALEKSQLFIFCEQFLIQMNSWISSSASWSWNLQNLECLIWASGGRMTKFDTECYSPVPNNVPSKFYLPVNYSRDRVIILKHQLIQLFNHFLAMLVTHQHYCTLLLLYLNRSLIEIMLSICETFSVLQIGDSTHSCHKWKSKFLKVSHYLTRLWMF